MTTSDRGAIVITGASTGIGRACAATITVILSADHFRAGESAGREGIWGGAASALVPHARPN